jgi:carbamoyl-phosphate synthase large subunit
VSPVNVLITAASRRVPLVLAFRNALGALGVPGRVIVTDVNPLSPAVHVADQAYRVPLADDPDYLPELLKICETEGIRLAIPTIDDELELFGRARSAFAHLGTMAACSSAKTSALCNDKYATWRALAAAGIPAARTYLPKDLPPKPRFPLFIKPRVGRGAVGAYKIRNKRELDFFLRYVERPVLQEFLDSPEYTIDVLCRMDGRPLSIVPRERVVIRAGVIDRGRTVKSTVLIELAEQVCAAIPFAGPINIQCRQRDGWPSVFEINPRFSGGIPLTIASGANFPKLLINMAMGAELSPQIGEFRDGVWMTSYEASVFLEETNLRLPVCTSPQPLAAIASTFALHASTSALSTPVDKAVGR